MKLLTFLFVFGISLEFWSQSIYGSISSTYSFIPQNNQQPASEIVNSIEINAIKQSLRPYVTVVCNGISVNWLYDTGADVSVMSENLFKEIKSKGKVVQINELSNITSASKDKLKILGKCD